jgi:hypothetical protein
MMKTKSCIFGDVDMDGIKTIRGIWMIGCTAGSSLSIQFEVLDRFQY